MGLIRGVLDRVVLVGGVLAGGTTPSFIAQYRQRISGRLDQVLQDLAPFQEIANLRHGGSLEALVQHHLKSTDATFHDEGAAIQAMLDAARRLREAVAGLEGTLTEQFWYLLRHPDASVIRATWDAYQPSFVLSVDGLIFATGVGLVIWLVFLGVWALMSSLVSPGRRRGSSRPLALKR